MSDLYDSLEDDCDDKKNLSDSLDECETTRLDTRPSWNQFAGSGPFYLKRNATEERSNLISNYNKAEPVRNIFLPSIENPDKGWKTTPPLIVDSQTLKHKGLQINKDGSFTKSPRLLEEELPFITREYRNLQFQKKKTYKMSNKTRRSKMNRKNLFSFTKNPVDGISMDKIISARQKKGSSEELLTSGGSLSSHYENSPKVKEKLLANDNLTDSMKAKLLQSPRGKSCKTLRVIGGVKKTQRVMNLLESQKNYESSGIFHSEEKPLKRNHEEPKLNSFYNERLLSNQKRIFGAKMTKQKSDIMLNGFKPSLSYSERRQMRSGFDPLHLRLESKKVLSDTNRSKFGDSVVERLSEVSSRVHSCENIPDEDEESFYRELIEQDKTRKHCQRSSRSEGPTEFAKLKSSLATTSYNEQRQVKQSSLKFKPISKSMSIDLPSETNQLIRNLKKYPNYCSADTSSNISKFELALKAKTYGYLANARNIFKMKVRSEGKLILKEGNDTSKFYEKNVIFGKKLLENNKKDNFSSKTIFPEIKRKVSRVVTTKATREVKDTQQDFTLPQVTRPGNKDIKIRKEILKHMSSCLKSPCDRT